MSIQLMVMSLDFESAGRPTTKIYNKKEITLGRDVSNDVVLNRPEVSAVHAKLRAGDRQNGSPALLLTDLGSSNGTMVESKALRAYEEIAVLPYQRIIIGNYLIKTAYFEGDEGEEEVEEGRRGSGRFRLEPMPEEEVQGREAEDGIADQFLDEEHLEVESSQEIALESDEPETIEEIAEADESQEPREFSGFIGKVLDKLSAQEQRKEESEPEAEADPVVEPLEDEESFTAFEPEKLASELPVQKTIEEDVLEQATKSEDVMETEPARSSGFQDKVEVFLNDNVEDLDFVARELLKIKGKVTHRGKPLSGVEITICDGTTQINAEDGSYCFADLLEGSEYSIKAMKAGFTFSCDTVGGLLESNVNADFSATQLFAVRGRVTYKGEPLAEVDIDGGSLGVITTAEDGSFVIPDVPEATDYEVKAIKPGFVFQSDKLSGRIEDQDAVVDFTTRKLFTISGRVIHRGQPMVDVDIDGGKLGRTKTDRDGKYSFSDVPEGESYTITATKDGFVFGTKKGLSGQN